MDKLKTNCETPAG